MPAPRVSSSGDNGAEDDRDYRGNSGFFNGSYFTGSEGALRTPAIVRYPGHVPGGQQTDDPVHITDMFTTLVRWAGAEVPDDRTIDGKDQCDFFEGKAETSAREGFLFWNGPTLYGVKWQHYKLLFRLQTYMFEPVQTPATPWVINLKQDPKERTPYQPSQMWVVGHINKLMGEFQESVKKEPLIPAGAPLDHVPQSG